MLVENLVGLSLFNKIRFEQKLNLSSALYTMVQVGREWERPQKGGEKKKLPQNIILELARYRPLTHPFYNQLYGEYFQTF